MCVREAFFLGGGVHYYKIITTVYLEVKGALRGVQRRREGSYHHPQCFARSSHRMTFPGSYCHPCLLHFNELY